MPVVARRRVHRQTGGLVEHQQLGVAVQRSAHAAFRKHPFERAAGLVVADHGKQHGLPSQGIDVARDVGGPARAFLDRWFAS